MLKKRTFNVVIVSKDNPIGFSFTPTPQRTVNYGGKPLQLKFD
jgi:hypothetical protein